MRSNTKALTRRCLVRIARIACAALGITIMATSDGSGAAPGSLKQVPGCVSDIGTDACTSARALFGVSGVTVRGKFVYTASYGSGIGIFKRKKRTGALTQLTGTAGCVSDDGTGGCADGKALGGSVSIVLSPKGDHAYVASFASYALDVFRRDPMTGTLTQLDGADGCLSLFGTGGDCAVGRILFAARSVDVSRDGENVYIATSSGVGVYARNAQSGALTELAGTQGCFTDDGSEGCTNARALNVPTALVVSRDGKFVYVTTGFSHAVVAFSRDPSSGALTQLAGQDGCVSDDGTGGECAVGRQLREPRALAISPDGKHLYVASGNSNAVAVFARNPSTGALTQLDAKAGCVSEDGSGDTCTDGRGLVYPYFLAFSGNGKHLYVVGTNSDSVAVLKRNKKTGILTPLPGAEGCVSKSGGECTQVDAIDDPAGLAVIGKTLYVTGYADRAVAVFRRK
jgi:DNA-binding beta-propeller fold protein YncE